MAARHRADVSWQADDDGDVIGFKRQSNNAVKRIARIEKQDGSEAGSSLVIIGSAAPSDADGRPDGTIYIQTA